MLSEGASVRRRALALLASRAFSGIELAARKKFWREAPLLDPLLSAEHRRQGDGSMALELNALPRWLDSRRGQEGRPLAVASKPLSSTIVC